VSQPGEKAARRAARERMVWYHDEQARLLVGRLTEVLSAYQREEIDVFEMDDLVARYGRARRALDRFCWTTGGGHVIAASLLDAGEVDDWWEGAADRRRR
jgi:hypothetical protein